VVLALYSILTVVSGFWISGPHHTDRHMGSGVWSLQANTSLRIRRIKVAHKKNRVMRDRSPAAIPMTEITSKKGDRSRLTQERDTEKKKDRDRHEAGRASYPPRRPAARLDNRGCQLQAARARARARCPAQLSPPAPKSEAHHPQAGHIQIQILTNTAHVRRIVS